MFTPDFYIDSLQNTKKLIADKVITDPALNKAATAYIDAQTKFAKMIVTNSIELARYSVENFNNYCFPKKDSTA